MPSNISIIIADPSRMAVIKERLRLPGHVMHFTSGNLAPAMENVRSYQPKLVAVDMLFAQTPTGSGFVERVEKLATTDCEIQLITQHDGRWVTVPRGSTSSVAPVVAAPAVAGSAPAIVPAPLAVVSTRRAPRFLVRDPLNAVVENGTATLVDISVLGAQVVSHPALRPNQTIKIALPDMDDMLRVTAHVAWSIFEKPKLTTEAYYRAGIEFTDAAQLSLEHYRLRHCAEDPIPYRGR